LRVAARDIPIHRTGVQTREGNAALGVTVIVVEVIIVVHVRLYRVQVDVYVLELLHEKEA
jgi:hypothetical protein